MNHTNSLINTIKSKIALNEKFKVIFYGDSSTSCERVHPNRREIIEYVIKMELEEYKTVENGIGQRNHSRRNLNFINAGLNGATTKDFLERAVMDVLSYNPDLVIFLGGANDTGKIDCELHHQHIKNLYTKLHKGCEYVYLITDIRTNDPAHNLDYQQLLDTYHDITFLDLFNKSSERNHSKLFTYHITKPEEMFLSGNGNINGIDAFHMNSLGNAYIAQYVLKNVFSLDFDPELYINDINQGKKYPFYS